MSSRIIDIMKSKTLGLVITESGNNYMRFGNNVLIQWVSFTTSGTWTYPKAFTTSPSVVIGDTITSSAEWHPTSVTTTTTAATIKRIQASHTSVVAVGY